MGILFGVLAAILLGASDITAARSTQDVKPITVTRTALLVSGLIVPILFLVKESQFRASDVLLASWCGLFLGSALLVLYKAYAIAPIGIVAPVTSVLMAAVPVVTELFFGERFGWRTWVGMALGLIGIVLTTYQRSADAAPNTKLGFLMALGAGAAFGVAFTMMAHMDERSGLTPVLVQRVVGMIMLVIVGLIRRDAPQFATARTPGRRYAIATGVIAGLAMSSSQMGFSRGPDGPVAVAISQFAAATVLFAVIFLKEKVRRVQVCGIAATAIGVACMALG